MPGTSHDERGQHRALAKPQVARRSYTLPLLAPFPAILFNSDDQPSTGALVGSSCKTAGGTGHSAFNVSLFRSPWALAFHFIVADHLRLH